MTNGSCRVIAVANQKGGVGKTTTTLNLGAGLAELGHRVLLVDMDHQASLSLALGVEAPDELEATTASLLTAVADGEDPDYQATILPAGEGMDLIPSSVELSRLDQLLSVRVSFGRELILKRLLAPLRADYDFILIDSAPALNVLTSNILVAADELIVPTTLAYLPFKGLDLLLGTVAQARAVNPGLALLGVLPTMRERRRNGQAEVLKALRTAQGLPVFSTEIPKSVVAEEAPGKGESVIALAPDSPLARSYRALAKEVA